MISHWRVSFFLKLEFNIYYFAVAGQVKPGFTTLHLIGQGDLTWLKSEDFMDVMHFGSMASKSLLFHQVMDHQKKQQNSWIWAKKILNGSKVQFLTHKSKLRKIPTVIELAFQVQLCLMIINMMDIKWYPMVTSSSTSTLLTTFSYVWSVHHSKTVIGSPWSKNYKF